MEIIQILNKIVLEKINIFIFLYLSLSQHMALPNSKSMTPFFVILADSKRICIARCRVQSGNKYEKYFQSQVTDVSLR